MLDVKVDNQAQRWINDMGIHLVRYTMHVEREQCMPERQKDAGIYTGLGHRKKPGFKSYFVSY